MSANKDKQNLRYRKVSKKINNKVRYDGLTKDEINYIKIEKQYEQNQKDLNNFWATAQRLDNGSVNWQNMSEKELDYFEYIQNKSEKLFKKLSKLENKVDIDKALNIFMQVNCHSASY